MIKGLSKSVSKSRRKYTHYLQDLGVYVYTKKQLDGCSFNIGYGGYDVLATDMKKGLWYYNFVPEVGYFYGPFSSKQAACRGFDKHVKYNAQASNT